MAEHDDPGDFVVITAEGSLRRVRREDATHLRLGNGVLVPFDGTAPTGPGPMAVPEPRPSEPPARRRR